MKKIIEILKRLFCKTDVNVKMIKSFVCVGDVIEVLHYGEKKIYKVEKFEVVMNGRYVPTEFVISVKFSYNDGKSYIECTSDKFHYVRHISHSN